MNYLTMPKESLKELQTSLKAQYKALQGAHLSLNMSRGKPGDEQLALVMGMLTCLKTREDLISEDGTDCRNYGLIDGIIEARRLIADLTGTKPENVFIGGNASLNLMYNMVSNAWIYGVNGTTPWSKQGKIRFLCPVPGYDRHFRITESFGIEMISIPMSPTGPDMDLVEEYVNHDPSVKGIWCVPKYSNPDGYTYSDETVRRFGALHPAAEDFRIFWDNAYLIHHLDFEDKDELLNIHDALKENGNEDLVYEFVSTSKIVMPGAGICALITSEHNRAEILKLMNAQMICFDKVNQMRHVKFFGSVSGIEAHMRKHAEILKPRFEICFEAFKELGEAGIATWTQPKGGYFISLYTPEGCARRTVQLCKEAGVQLTGAGAAFPYGRDPKDSHIRIAPTYPSSEDLKKACDVLIVCAKLAAIEKLLA